MWDVSVRAMMTTFTRKDMEDFFSGKRDTTTAAVQHKDLEQYRSSAVRRLKSGEAAPPIKNTIKKPSKKALGVRRRLLSPQHVVLCMTLLLAGCWERRKRLCRPETGEDDREGAAV